MIIAVYVDDFNLVGTTSTSNRAVSLLTTQFEMKLLSKITFCLGLQVAYLRDGSNSLHHTIKTSLRLILRKKFTSSRGGKVKPWKPKRIRAKQRGPDRQGLPNGQNISLHHTTYTQNFLKRFHMDQASPLSTPMMG